MWCTNSTLTDYEAFSTTPITVRDNSNVQHNVYYMTFRVTVDSAGRTVIRRIHPNSSTEYTAYVLVGLQSTYSPYSLAYKILPNSDFSTKQLSIEHYNYGTQITLLKVEPTGSYSGMNQFSMYSPSGGAWFKPEVNWNYKWSDNTLQSLDTSLLDDYPIWNSQWHA
jgi:hypothetical protein